MDPSFWFFVLNDPAGLPEQSRTALPKALWHTAESRPDSRYFTRDGRPAAHGKTEDSACSDTNKSRPNQRAYETKTGPGNPHGKHRPGAKGPAARRPLPYHTNARAPALARSIVPLSQTQTWAVADAVRMLQQRACASPAVAFSL